jgi:inorganic pyrophosphatase
MSDNMTAKEFADGLRRLADEKDPPAKLVIPTQTMSLQEGINELKRLNGGRSVCLELTINWYSNLEVTFRATIHGDGFGFNGCEGWNGKTVAHVVQRAADFLAGRDVKPITVEQAGELVDAATAEADPFL